MRQKGMWGAVGLGLSLGLVLGLAGPGYPQGASLKVGVINLKDIFDNYQKVKDFTQKLTVEGKAIEQEIELLNQELRQLDEKLQGLKNVQNKTKEDLQLQFILAKAKQEFLVKNSSAQFSQRLAERTSDFYNEIRKKVEDIAKAEGYDLVFKIDAPEIEGDSKESIITQRINHRPLLYARPEMDFTMKVVKGLNDDYARQGATDQPVGQPPATGPQGGQAPAAAPAGSGAGSGTGTTPGGAAPPKQNPK